MSSPSYRDEKAVVNYVLGRLEERLAGRGDTEIVNTLPSDHCQLGVLVPWSIDPNTADPADPADPVDDEADASDKLFAADAQQKDQLESDDGLAQVALSSTPVNEPFSAIEEAARRPPSSLGMVFALRTEAGNDTVQMTMGGQFAIYTRHFPTYQEQKCQIGEIVPDDEGIPGNPRRHHVSLVEKCKRHVIPMPPVAFTLTKGQTAQLTDSGAIQAAVNEELQRVEGDPSLRRQFAGRQVVPIAAMVNEESYNTYIASLIGPVELPPLRVSCRLRVRPVPEGQLRVEVYVCNDTPRDTEVTFNDQFRILADVNLEVEIVGGHLVPAEILPVPDDYQYDRRVLAVGRNVSVEVRKDHRSIRTRAMARFEQPRMATSDRVPAAYTELAEKPFDALERIRQAMLDYADDWRKTVLGHNSYGLSPAELNACTMDLQSFEEEISTFTAGIAALAADKRLEMAFRAMNRAFAAGKYSRWRLFQIVFIVSQLPALVIREGITQGQWPAGSLFTWEEVLERADVLWFPTGGGKTEAYLGLVSCAALYDRLRGKGLGVTAWLRFPLRMLSVQQLQRSMRVLWSTEVQRQELAKTTGGTNDLGDPISLGYFVGGNNTPNGYFGRWSFANLRQDQRLRERLLLINDCPACGSEGSVEIKIDEERRRVRHVCSSCATELSVYISDEETFRFMPSLVVGTVDKMAAIAYQPKVAMLWTGPRWRCGLPEHGYGVDDWCLQDCPTNPNAQNPQRIRRHPIAAYDPAPAFHIQDELHLLQEELGAFAGHYETMVRSNERAVATRPSKVLAATATISGYRHQAQQIYGVKEVRRIPSRGHHLMETFYTTADLDPDDAERRTKVMRVFTAFRPPYLRASDAAALCTETIHEVINDLHADPYGTAVLLGLQDARTEEEVLALLGYYSRTLTYVGKRDSGTRIKERIERDCADPSRRLRPTAERDLNVEYLASHSTLREIAATIKRAEADTPWQERTYLDATVATDVISHGVDVDRYNLMVLERIPEQIAGYIQVSSRAGRQHVGLVLSVLPRYSLRASSIYDRFSEFHQHLDRMVAPVPVNRFAKTAVDRSFPGVLLGVLYGRHSEYVVGSKEQRLRKLAQSLRDGYHGPLTDASFLGELLHAYALEDGIYDTALETQMIARLRERYARFRFDVRNVAYRELPEVFDPRPMASLRDVDVAVPFGPDDATDWRDLLWFHMHL